MNKKLTSHIVLMIFGFLVVAFITILDMVGASMWASVDGVKWGDSYVKAKPIYMKLFWSFAFGIITTIFAVVLWLRRDLSEAIGLALTPLILLWAGLEDLLFMLFSKLPLLGQPMEWLNGQNTLYAWIGDKWFSGVTGTSILISVIFGVGIVIMANLILFELNSKKKFLGMGI